MFGLFGRSKEEKNAANRIGVKLHRQILEALQKDEQEASKKLSSPFSVGYLYGFIRLGFTHQGMEGERLADKYLKHICNGILPGKLYDIFQRQFAAIELAKDLGKNDEIEQFGIGVEAGAYDAEVFNIFITNETQNLTKYLTNEEIEYKPLPK